MATQAHQHDIIGNQQIHSTGLEPVAVASLEQGTDPAASTFWDDPQFQIVSEAPQSVVSGGAAPATSDVLRKLGSKVGWGSLVIIMVAFAAILIWYVAKQMDRHPLEALAKMFRSWGAQGEQESPASADGDRRVATTSEPKVRSVNDDSFEDEGASDESTEPNSQKPIPDNPYWALPNSIYGGRRPGAPWTLDVEERWRSGIVHRYPYQRLKTVQKVRRERRIGAETILWDALEDKKEWVRFFGAIGLAEYDIPISSKVLLRVIGKARSELIAGFFERFVQRPNAGQAYLMRQLIRLLDERGRLVCLRAIWNTRDPYRDLYLAAGTVDPNPRVSRWVQDALLQRSMPLAKYDRMLAIIRGEAQATEFQKLEKQSSTIRLSDVDGDSETMNGISVHDKGSNSDGIEEAGSGAVEFWDAPSTEPNRKKRPVTHKDFEYEEEPAGKGQLIP